MPHDSPGLGEPLFRQGHHPCTGRAELCRLFASLGHRSAIELSAFGQGADAAVVEEKLKTAIEAGFGCRADCNTLL